MSEQEKILAADSDTNCSVKGCPNAGIYEYDGWVDQFITLHFDERVATPLCADHYHSKEKAGKLPFGEWMLDGLSVTKRL